MYPVFLKLAGRRVVLVGGGRVAAGKLDGLLAAGADVVVIAPAIRPELERPGVALRRRPFDATDLDGAWWAVAAAPPEVNRQVQAAAEPRGVFVNAVDDPPHATAYLGGVVRRDDVTMAISTGGRAPALAGLLREALEAWLPDAAELNRWLQAADAARRRWRAEGVPMEARRPLLLDTLNRLYEGRETTRAPDESGNRRASNPNANPNDERRTTNGEPRTANDERRTANDERRTANRTPNHEHERRTKHEEP